MSDNNKDEKDKYRAQNKKLWTINFSSANLVAKAKIIFPAVSSRAKCPSIGMAILYAVEYCIQEHVIQDFLQYATSRRESV